MENITHTLFGVAMGQTGLKKITKLGMATLMISANLPDFDLLYSYYSETSYLIHHRGISHSFLGLIPEVLGLSTIMYFIAKKLDSKNPIKENISFKSLLLLSSLGVLSHFGLDYLNDYGLRPFLPISDNKYMSSLIFIIDIWFWLILGGYVYLTTNLNKFLKIIFSVLSLLSLVLLFSFPQLPLMPKLLYLLGFISVYFSRTKLGQINSKKFSVFVFSIFFSYIALTFVIKSIAEKNFINYRSTIIKEDIQKYRITPLPLSFFEWQFLASNKDKVFIGTTNSLNKNIKVTKVLETNLSDNLTQKALNTDTGKVMNDFADFLFSYKKEDKDYIYVYLRDAKYLLVDEKGFATKIIKFKK